FTALSRDQFVHADDSLDAVLSFVLGVIDNTVPEDVVIWDAARVVAVVFATGIVVRLDALPVASAA
ncbi:MAG TPA: hypothetical protein VFW33_02895, partial [Gemmataceae bacterium]|nr:hypothetical protein [Gemmataceae bacterium]